VVILGIFVGSVKGIFMAFFVGILEGIFDAELIKEMNFGGKSIEIRRSEWSCWYFDWAKPSYTCPSLTNRFYLLDSKQESLKRMQRVLKCLIQGGQSNISKRMLFSRHFLQAFLWSFWTFSLALFHAFFDGILEGIFDPDLIKEMNFLGKSIEIKRSEWSWYFDWAKPIMVSRARNRIDEEKVMMRSIVHTRDGQIERKTEKR
jgi:hypothetical protein